MSIERKKMFELLREKRRTCKTCGNMVFGTVEELVVSRVSISERQSSIFCVMCPNCSKKEEGDSSSVSHVDVLIAGVQK
jgi:RNase P subunit RPR2